MTRVRKRDKDQRIEQIIGNLLRVGLLIATAVVVAGAAVYLYRHGGDHVSYRIFRGEPLDLRMIDGIAALAADWRGRGLMQFGLLLLLATPVARVAFSVLAFARERDWFYVGVTMIVLTVLLYSMVGGYR